MFHCSTDQHGRAAPGSPQLVAVLALARVYQRGLGHLNIFLFKKIFLLFCKYFYLTDLSLVVRAEGGAGAWYGGQGAHPLLASPRQAGLRLLE